MEAEKAPLRWEGKHSAEINGATASQIWPLVSDFCSLHKWLPTVDTCHRVHGVDGQPGLIRYCASEESKGTVTSWANERLLTIDPEERVLSYEILDNNLGFRSYVATVKVIPMDGGDEAGCKIEWSFVSDPVDGWKSEDFDSYISCCVRNMAKKMLKACCMNNDNEI